jgi:hypothetical protein
MKDKSLIPDGLYCYHFDKSDKNSVKTKFCPYSVIKNINGVDVNWCDYINEGDTGNCSDEDFEKLVEYYGSTDNVDENLKLSILWDGCKECGINDDVEYTQQDILNWIKRVDDASQNN